MVAVWQQQGADSSFLYPVTLRWACPHSVAGNSNGCNTLEDLITTQAALRDMLGMLKPPPFNCCHFSPSAKKSPFWLHLKTVRSEKDKNNVTVKLTSVHLDYPLDLCASLTVLSVWCQIAYVLKYVVSLLISHDAQLT